VRILAIASLLILAGCAEDPSRPPPREIAIETTIAVDGRSAPIAFEVPEATRSITVIVEGVPTALYALGGYTLADGVDRVALAPGPPGPAMQASYRDEMIGQMPGELHQSIRLGTFTHVYPYRPGQLLDAGAASIVIAADSPGPVRVRVLMPEDDGASVLPINIVVVSDTLFIPNTQQYMDELSRIFAQAGITVSVGVAERLTGTALEDLTQSTEPQEAPGNQATMLTSLVTDADRPGLDVFFVESLRRSAAATTTASSSAAASHRRSPHA
jgi:hypothetical protein